MKKPMGYDDVHTSGDFTPIELGGHTAVIKRVKETTSRNGKPMLQVAIDFDANDSQSNYFMTMFQNDTREDKKWSYLGTQYILTEDDQGRCSRSFKSFITSVENSNNAECVWGDGFERWFTNKKIGVVFGEKEEEYNGEIKTRRRIRYFCSYDKAKDAAIPNKIFLNISQPVSNTNAGGFVNIPESTDEEIPF